MYLLIAPAGCATRSSETPVLEQTSEVTVEFYDDRSWATVLRENVHPGEVDGRLRDGLVNYEHLIAHRAPLDDHLAMIARVGPASTPDFFPTPAGRVCYYANAYNAGVLLAVVRAAAPESMHGAYQRSLDARFRFRVDGRVRKLGWLRRRAIEASGGDARVLFALCDAALGSPPLPHQPLRPEGLDETLRSLAEAAMANQAMVSVDHEHQRLELATTLFAARDAFIEQYKSATGANQATMLNVVLHFAGSVRRQWLNTAVGYAESMIPFDRRLNRWTKPE